MLIGTDGAFAPMAREGLNMNSRSKLMTKCLVLAFLTCTACSDPAAPLTGGSSVDAGTNIDRGLQIDGTTARDMNIPIIDSSIIEEDAMPDAAIEMVDAAVNVDAGPDLDDFIRMFGTLPSEEPSKLEREAGESFEEGDYRCTTRQVTETQRHEQLVAYQTNSEALWPGALVRGNAIADGLLTQAVVDRAPLDFSVSLQNLAGNNSGRMDDPSLSQYRNEIQRILSAGVEGATPAYIFSEIEEIHSEAHLGISLGLNVAGLTGMVASSFDFQDNSKRSRFLVNFVQAYYTVDVDPPASPSGFFAPGVSIDDVFDAFGGPDGGPPLYVSSITYGRRVIFTAESNVSMSELRSALEFAYSGGVVDVDGSVSLTNREVLQTASMTAFILGGSGEQAVQAINGLDDLREFIQGGGNYSSDSPGAPIAYKLAHLADNSLARMSYTTDYDVKECERVSQRVLIGLDSITTTDGGNQVRIYGDVTARANDRNGQQNEVNLFDVDRSDAFELDEGDTWPPQGTGNEGVLNVSPRNGEAIRLRVRLHDRDFPNDDDANATVDLAFEGGWRHECDGPRNGGRLVNTDGRRVRYAVRFCIRPIP